MEDLMDKISLKTTVISLIARFWDVKDGVLK